MLGVAEVGFLATQMQTPTGLTATFMPLAFSTTGGMEAECKRYHCRLAELVATKNWESYAPTMSWIRARVSFALLRPALLC